MATSSSKPYIISLPQPHGFIRGVTLSNPSTSRPQCHRFGGIPYANPNFRRWQRAKPHPEDWVLGGESADAAPDYTGRAKICPQPDTHSYNVDCMDESCLEVDIWLPVGDAPRGGWPVWIFIHGGYLQWGSTSMIDPTALLSSPSSPIRAIIVAPAYRLNVFGFLASAELMESNPVYESSSAGNLGFWDQRLAIEWTGKYIHLFDGNAANITLGGLSAGAHSTFHQLAYEVGLPDEAKDRYIKRVLMISNGAGVQPKTMEEQQDHFNALLTALKIPLDLPGSEKIKRLQSLPHQSLTQPIPDMPLNQFRATTILPFHPYSQPSSTPFVSPTLFPSLTSGLFSATLTRRHIPLMIGDVRDERNAYKQEYPPSSYISFYQRLHADYPENIVKRLVKIYIPNAPELPPAPLEEKSEKSEGDEGEWGWKELFGRVYSDMQVYVTMRGLVGDLVRSGSGRLGVGHGGDGDGGGEKTNAAATVTEKDTEAEANQAPKIYRYSISWRATCVDAVTPPELGVTHGTDMAIWMFGNGWGEGLDAAKGEGEVVREWLVPFARFIEGKEEEEEGGEGGIGWGTEGRGERVVRVLDGQGRIGVEVDGQWERCLRVWEGLRGVGEGGE
ncbi:hypothetical protein MMC25_002234 [Agyrium rufum]|nr:hypothetical protein [Agyrium rufum]